MMHLSWLTWMLTVLLTRVSSYQAPYVDIEDLPPIGYYEPGDINVAYMNAFSSKGSDGKLCKGSAVYSNSGRTTEAAR